VGSIDLCTIWFSCRRSHASRFLMSRRPSRVLQFTHLLHQRPPGFAAKTSISPCSGFGPSWLTRGLSLRSCTSPEGGIFQVRLLSLTRAATTVREPGGEEKPKKVWFLAAAGRGPPAPGLPDCAVFAQFEMAVSAGVALLRRGAGDLAIENASVRLLRAPLGAIDDSPGRSPG
jgi:hypothetical protein